jgi:hypothetical protein
MAFVPATGADTTGGPVKNDVTYLVIMITFFALAALFVIACDKIIGSDDEALAVGDEEITPAPEPERLAA